MTNFIHDTIEAVGLSFTFDGNSKITASNGSFEDPKPNAFSLVQISDCPGSTPTCREGCYVHGLQELAPEVHKAYQINSVNIRSILMDELMTIEVSNSFADWISANCKEFRWHVSGDIISREYARFIRGVAEKSPGVLHWIYTRSFDFLDHITGPGNLVVNLSADKDNIEEALTAHFKYNLRICYLTVDGSFPALPADSVIFPDYDFRGREDFDPVIHPWWTTLELPDRKKVCPVDFFGQSESLRCGKCTKCMVPFKEQGEYNESI